MLQAATVFSESDNSKYRQAAYRIATTTWKFTGKTESEYKDIVTLILSRLGNFPTGDYLFGSFGKWIDKNLKGAPWFEATSHRIDNAFFSNGDIQFVFTDFQTRIWKTLYEEKSIAVTAPTSAGKSFALQLFLAYKLLKVESFISIYLVPTRALINQVTSALYRLIETSKEDIIISSVPATPEELNMHRGVYVVTQERLQVLLDASDNLPVDLTVIDESQMLAEGSRGVILHSVLERIKEENPHVQFLFGSPQTKNPDLYEKIFNLDSVVTLSEIESPIAQNLIFVNTNAIKRNILSLSALVDGVRRDLGQIKISTELYGDKLQRLAYLSWFFGKGNKNLVYYGGQAACEDIATKLLDLFNKENAVDVDTEIKNLSDLIKEQIHPKFLLAKTIESGIAFHYGNIPPLIRKTIEDYFVEGKLSYIVCTSTLLQGVNLPAKNIFMLDPTKRVEWNTKEDIPISSVDFWNLAGRAGRLGKDLVA